MTGNQQAFRHILKRSLITEEIVVLKYKSGMQTDLTDLLFGDMRHVMRHPVKYQTAAVSGLEKIDAPQKGGLSAARRAEHCDHITLFHRHGYPVKNDGIPE